MSAASPIFLVGSERSGTTLLRLMLDHHPLVAFHMEAEFMVKRMPDGPGFPDVREYVEWLATDRVFSMSGFACNPALDYPSLLRDFLEQKRTRDNKPIVGATVHKHFDRLLRVWPDARFIHIVRDGRDVARSVIQIGWAGNVWVAADVWLEAERLWDSMRRTLPPDRFLEVTYEGLVTDPRATLERVCAFLGVAYDEAMFDYAKRTTYKMPDPSLLNQWRRKMPEPEVRLFEARAGDMLDARGFPRSGLPAMRVGPLRRAWLALHSRLWKVGFRWKRYGGGLFLADVATRRLGMRGARRSVRLRMNQVELRHIK